MLIEAERENYFALRFLDQFMVGHKGFICGGCFKNIFNGEKVKDIDVFFKNSSDHQEAVDCFAKNGEEYEKLYENSNVCAFRHKRTGVVVELCKKIFGTAEQILNRFDFSITKFAYHKVAVEDATGAEVFGVATKDTHIEYRVLMDDHFFEHLHLKRLVIDNEIPFPMSTYERMFRYVKYGFSPCRETKMKLIKAIRELSDQQVELSESLYDGMD